MRVLFWYCDQFAWNPAIKTLENAAPAESEQHQCAIVAFIHVEPKDVEEGSSAAKKLLKNTKWLVKKWQQQLEDNHQEQNLEQNQEKRTQNTSSSVKIILHSFTHLGEEKAEPEQALALLNQVEERLKAVNYSVSQTPYGYFLDLNMQAKGHPLARIYKEF